MSRFSSPHGFDQQTQDVGAFNGPAAAVATPAMPARAPTFDSTANSASPGNGPGMPSPYGAMPAGYTGRRLSPVFRTPSTPPSVRPVMSPVFQQQPNPDADLPSDRRMRLRDEGIIPNTPSPQFAASPEGQARFGTPAPNQGAVAGGGTVAAQASPTHAGPTKQDLGHLNQLYAEARAYHSAGDDEGAQASLKEARELRQRVYGQQAATGGQPAATTQPTGQQPALPVAQQPIQVDPEQRKRSIMEAYATAARSLDENPNLGTTPVKANAGVPVQAPLTPVSNDAFNGGAAGREQASAQAQRNQAVIQRRNNAAAASTTGDATQRNIDQLDQNQTASRNIGLRGQQFAQGDYNLSHAPGAVQGSPPAQVAQATPQGQQAQGGTYARNPQTGERRMWNGSAWIPAQQ